MDLLTGVTKTWPWGPAIRPAGLCTGLEIEWCGKHWQRELLQLREPQP